MVTTLSLQNPKTMVNFTVKNLQYKLSNKNKTKKIIKREKMFGRFHAPLTEN